MNDIFSVKRFGLLLKKTLFERPIQFFGYTGLMLLFIFIVYAFVKSQIGFQPAQNLSFIWGLAGGGCFLASFVFSHFSSNASGSSFLTLPASTFEKWLCGAVIAGVLYPLVFLIFFRIMDISFVAIYHNHLDPGSPSYKTQYNSVYIFPLNGLVAGRVFPMFVFLAGAMMVGSLYFNKVSFIKVAIAICLVMVTGFSLNWAIARIFFGNINDAGPFNHVTIPVGKEEGFLELPKTMANIYFYFFVYIIPAVLWLISYIRLREKEF
jgi:hypothetical protein